MRWLPLIAVGGILLGSSSPALPAVTTGQDAHAAPDIGVVTTIPVGRAPRSVAVDPFLHRAYVANSGSSAVSVIDGINWHVLATVPVGEGPCCVALDPDTHRVYVANTKGDTVSVLDGLANQPIATVPTGDGPYALAVDLSSHTVYVADNGDRATIKRLGGYDPRLRLIDGASDQIVAAQPVVAEAAGNDLIQVAGMAGDAGTHSVILAVTRKESSGLVILDSGTHQEIGAIGLTSDIPGIVVASAFDGTSRVLVLSESPGFLGFLALGPGQQYIYRNSAERPCGHNSCVLRLTVDPSTRTAYAARANAEPSYPTVSPALLVEDERGTLLASAPLGQSPSAIDVDPSTHTIYVTDDASNTVTLFRGIGYSAPLPSTLPPTGGGGGVGVGVGRLAAPDSPCPAD